MINWSYKRVTLQDVWPGTPPCLSTPLNVMPEFSLHPRYLRDAKGNPQLAHYTVDFPSGYLEDGWQGVNFIPLGKNPPTGISGLPAYSSATQAQYRSTIGAAWPKWDSNTERLEANIPYFTTTGGVAYHTVRLYYIVNAVTSGIADLVVVRSVALAGLTGTVQGRQDGTGDGPPH